MPDIGPAYHPGNMASKVGTSLARWFRDLAGLLPDEECAT